MTDENKQPAEFKITKEGLLIVAIISLVILIVYFTLTVADMSVFISLDKDNSNKWGDVLWLLTGVALLLLLYLVVTNRFYGVYRKLIDRYIAFVDQTTQSSQKTQFIMMVIIIALAVVARELYSICSTRWIILSARLSSPAEPLNLRNILIGIAGAVTLGFAWRRLRIADQQKDAQVKQTESHIRQTESHIRQTESYIEQTKARVKQTEIESDRRLSERFDTAVAALSKDLNENTFPAHLGAISSLRALAIDSPENTQRCLDIICSCNQWMDGYMNEFIKAGSLTPYSSLLLNEDNRIAKTDDPNKKNQITLLHEKRSQEALVAISHILTEISVESVERLKGLKFHNKMLCGISLDNLKLNDINFRNTHLVAASLRSTSLNRANLIRANLQGASLERAELRGASLNSAELQEASLERAELQGASLWYAKLQGAHLKRTNLQETDLRYANLQEALLINAQLQGAKIHDVDLSYAMLLDCNLYGATLKDIKGKNIIFNDIVKIGDIESEDKRKKYLDDICQHLKPTNIKSFREKMGAAWKAMENNQRPDGLEVIKEKSIVTKDSQGMYDIREEDLTSLEERWKKLVNEKGTKFLWDIRLSILSLGLLSYRHIDIANKKLDKDVAQNKNIILANTLRELTRQIIIGD